MKLQEQDQAAELKPDIFNQLVTFEVITQNTVPWKSQEILFFWWKGTEMAATKEASLKSSSNNIILHPHLELLLQPCLAFRWSQSCDKKKRKV